MSLRGSSTISHADCWGGFLQDTILRLHMCNYLVRVQDR